MGMPQIIMSVLIIISYTINFKNAYEKNDLVLAISVSIATAFQVGILFWGGFYN